MFNFRFTAVTLGCIFLLGSTPAISQTNCLTKGKYFVAISEEIHQEAMDYIVQRDEAALKKLFDAGAIFTLKPNLSIQVKTVGFLGAKVKIRLKGTTVWLWTVREEVRC